MKIVESMDVTEAAEDWSRVRSPSRARRRLKKGYRQNIRHYRKPTALQMGDTIYCHPAIAKALREAIPQRSTNVLDLPREPTLEVMRSPIKWEMLSAFPMRRNSIFNSDVLS